MRTKNQPDYGFITNLVHQINEDLTRSHKHILQTSVLFDARIYAERNLPAQNEPLFETYLTSIKAQYKALKKNISVNLKGGMQNMLASATIPSLNEKINGLKIAIKKAIDKIRNLETDKSRIVVDCSNQAYKYHNWLIFLFGLAESLLTMSCFLRLGDIVIIAAVVGAVIGLAQIFAVKATVLAIREVTDRRKRKRYYTIALVGFSLFSLLFGAMRYHFAHVGAAAGVPFAVVNPFSFAALNMLIVIASALLVHFFHPSIADTKKLDQIKEIDSEIKKTLAELQEFETAHDALIIERQEVFALHEQIKHDQTELLTKVNALYDDAVGTFKTENIAKRTDGMFPECFKHLHEPLADFKDDEFPQITTK